CSRLILRPFTPPLAFSAPIRALHPVAEPSLADAATPVSEEMYPSVTSLSVTPGELPACAPAPVARTPTVVRPNAATTAANRRPRFRRSLIPSPQWSFARSTELKLCSVQPNAFGTPMGRGSASTSFTLTPSTLGVRYSAGRPSEGRPPRGRSRHHHWRSLLGG